MMAIRAEAPINPISISGSRKIMRRDEWGMHPGVVRITFHDPIATTGCTIVDWANVMQRVREAIISGLAREESPLSPEETRKT
jgi:1-acyl-sn-glycerol-3-phosphate acyltransferase